MWKTLGKALNLCSRVAITGAVISLSQSALGATLGPISLSITTSNTSWTGFAEIEKFDTNLGRLTDVEISLTAQITAAGGIEYVGGSHPNSSTTMTLASEVSVLHPLDGSLWLQSTPKITVSTQLEAFDGMLDFSGPSGFNVGGVNSPSQTAPNDPVAEFVKVSLTADDSELLEIFSGPGSISLIAKALGASEMSGASDTLQRLFVDAGADIEVVYHYSPHIDIAPAPVPLPAAVWFFAVAVCSISRLRWAG